MALLAMLVENFGKIVLSTLAAFLSYLLCYAIYNIYFHPLSHVPGPILWTSTRLRYLLSIWSGYLHTDIQDLHRKYGQIIRVAPDEVSFAVPDAWSQIYSNTSGTPAFPKSKLWHGAAPGRPMSVLNALDPKVHARFRKAMDPAFTEKAVRAQEPVIQTRVALFISQLDKLVAAAKENEGVIVNIVRWLAFVTFDVVGDLGFGETFGCLETSEYHPWVSMIFTSLRAATYRASLRYYPQLSPLMGFLAVPKSVMQQQIQHWKQSVDKINRRLASEKERPDLISMMKRDDDGVDGITTAELQATTSVLIVAGSETTVSVLSGTTNYLVKNPDKLALLAEEVRRACNTERDITLSAFKDLPYLNAVLQEGLRLCNPTPVGAPRVTPPGGATVCGTWLPGETFVNVHPLALNRSPVMFHDPNAFHPERWLSSAPPAFSEDKKNAVQAFGVGPRSCIGRPLAWAELRLILGRLVWRFDLQEADTEAGRLDWQSQRVFSVVERKPFEVRLKLRQGLAPIHA
ncbi:cytochrome P450 [Massariosphaeria phaeospora]|uniref:Cytochrome P450 n=1 Tax=Massariosphaeria phaeospora TaxID=100035 RepID=A0A7C8MFY9_9PLEO|nr:cytochrome P450 [Massariosphaeria phaeospora]